MSYYYKFPFSFSYHGLQRCKERLDMKDRDEYEVKNEVIKLMQKSTKSFETRKDLYISAGNTNLFFVINKQNKLLITATKVSAQKQLDLVMSDSYY